MVEIVLRTIFTCLFTLLLLIYSGGMNALVFLDVNVYFHQ